MNLLDAMLCLSDPSYAKLLRLERELAAECDALWKPEDEEEPGKEAREQ